MTERPDHSFELELAAAYALDALDEDDERRFVNHLETCARCRTEVSALREVAALLGEASGGPEPSPSLRDRIISAAVTDRDGTGYLFAGLGGDDPSSHPNGIEEHLDGIEDGLRAGGPERSHPFAPSGARVISLRRRLLAVAAAVVVVLGGVLGAVFGGSGGQSGPPVSCSSASSCTAVTLTSAVTHQSVATVMVVHRTVWVRPSGMRSNDPSKQIYVLWQIVGHAAPRAVGGFDVVHGHRSPISVGALSVPEHSVTAFALSLERGRVVPAAPTHVLAIRRLS